MREQIVVSADREAEATLEAVDPAAGPAIDVADPALAQLARAADVVSVERVAAVDPDVARLQVTGGVPDRGLGRIAGWAP